MPDKKDVFTRPDSGRIRKDREPVVARGSIIESLQTLDPEKQYLLIPVDVIPKDFFAKYQGGRRVRTRTDASRKFMKHGREITFPRFRSIDDALKHSFPDSNSVYELQKAAFDNARKGYYCAYSYVPLSGNDRRKRKVALTEVLEAAKLYAYAARQKLDLEVRPYDAAKRVEYEGATVTVRVPSREPKRERYDIVISGIPVVDSKRQVIVSLRTISDHVCKDVQMRGIRFRQDRDAESSNVFNWDAHDIAGWFTILDYYWNEKHNLVPYRASQIPIPSRELVKIYDLLVHSTVIESQEKPGAKKDTYPLNNGELEAIVQGAVNLLGFDRTLTCNKKRDGDLRDYAWIGL
jgi:hypothetical protein